MARFFHGGKNAVDPAAYAADATDDESRKRLMDEAVKNHPLSHPHSSVLKKDGDKVKIRVPSMFCKTDQMGKTIEEWADWEPGSVTLGLPGHGYFVIPPGGYVDLDSRISEKTVKANAPHLLTEAESQARGLIEPPPVFKKSAAEKAKAEKFQ